MSRTYSMPTPPSWGEPEMLPQGQHLSPPARWTRWGAVVVVSLDNTEEAGVSWHLSCSFRGRQPNVELLQTVRALFNVPDSAEEDNPPAAKARHLWWVAEPEAV